MSETRDLGKKKKKEENYKMHDDNLTQNREKTWKGQRFDLFKYTIIPLKWWLKKIKTKINKNK